MIKTVWLTFILDTVYIVFPQNQTIKFMAVTLSNVTGFYFFPPLETVLNLQQKSYNVTHLKLHYLGTVTMWVNRPLKIS